MSFQDYKAQPRHALAIFTGHNCPACVALKPRLQSIASNADLELREFATADELQTARNLGLRQVPAVVLVYNGQADVLFTGNQSDARILEVLRGKGLVD